MFKSLPLNIGTSRQLLSKQKKTRLKSYLQKHPHPPNVFSDYFLAHGKRNLMTDCKCIYQKDNIVAM